MGRKQKAKRRTLTRMARLFVLLEDCHESKVGEKDGAFTGGIGVESVPTTKAGT